MASGTSPKKDKVILLLKQGETSPTSIANKVGYAVSYARLVKNEFSSVSGSGLNPYDWTEMVRRAWRGGALFS
jgi:hypothetical protein